MSRINLFCSNNKRNKKIKVTGNLAQYWGNFAKLWAVSDTKVNQEDYSAKYYAQQAKESETNISETVEDFMESVDSEISAYVENKEQEISEAVAQIKDDFEDEVEDKADEAVAYIQSAVTSIPDLTTVMDNITSISAVSGSIGDVNTVADNIQAVQDFSVAKDMLNQSKGLLTGSVSTDCDCLADVKSYVHNSFDINKFSKIGSPTITNDGIASGFSDNNYLKPNVNFNSTANVEFLFKNVYIVISNSNQNNDLFFGSSNGTYAKIGWNKTTRILNLYNGSAWTTSSYALSVNTFYDFKLNWNGTTYSLYAKLSSENGWAFVTSFNNSNNILYSNLWIGRNNTNVNEIFGGSIDLKQFSITVDGVEVFSGNKTGIDTIKPDNYEAPSGGSLPTISSDGIASGFSSSNYLSSSAIIDTTKPWKATFSITTSTLGTAQGLFALSQYFYLVFSSNTTLQLRTTDNTQENWVSTDVGLKNNTDYYIECGYDGSKIFLNYKEIGGSFINKSITPSGYVGVNNLQIQSIGTYSTYQFAGTIDLNVFKVYVDGDLVYQPCLKIPYTESKTGSKIVDSIYRDRVNDMYEQFGYANYYTLQDEPKSNYTLVDSPTISSDFVASGFSSSNYIGSSVSLINNHSFKIIGKFNSGTLSSSDRIILCDGNSGWNNCLGIKNSDIFYSIVSGSGKTMKHRIEANTDYDIEIEYNITSALYKVKECTSSTYTLSEIIDTTSVTFNYSNIILGCLGGNNHSNPFTGGSIDLKEFKIYVDNKLAYEAVTDPNFTLPQGELYGMIQRLENKKADINKVPSLVTPDYAHGIEISADYTAPSDGYISATDIIVLSQATRTLTVNDITVSKWYNGNESLDKFSSGLIPVSKGDVFKSSSYSNINIYFYPMKGV